jgi:hypothetical protein
MSGENPLFAQHATHTGHEKLGQVLDSMGLDYEPTHGRYDKPERSYIIHNPTVEQMQQLGKQFGQESVVHSQNGQPRLIYTNGPNEGLATQPPDPAQHYSIHTQQPEDYYTAIPGPHGEPYGWFTYNLDFKNPLQPVNPQAQQPAPALKHEVMVGPVEAAYRLAKGVVEEYHAVLLDLRMRELAKAQPGEQVAPHQEPGVHEPSGAPHVEPGVHEKPAQVAKKSESTMAKSSSVSNLLKAQVAASNKANGGQVKTAKAETNAVKTARANGGSIKVLGKDEIPANKANGGQVTTAKAEMVASNKTNGGQVTTAKAEMVPSNKTNGGQTTLGKDEFKPTNRFTQKLAGVREANAKDKALGKDELDGASKLCKGCGGKLSPVQAALAKGHERCAKCLKSAIEKGEWKPRAGKDLTPSKSGHGGDPKALKKEAAKMSTPKAPKPPQAAGAAPTLHKAFMLGTAGKQNLERQMGPTPTGTPSQGPAPKAQPKPPSEYDAAAFRPASPGAAGAPSGLELDAPKKFAYGTSGAAPAMPKPQAVAKPASPIAGLSGIRR